MTDQNCLHTKLWEEWNKILSLSAKERLPLVASLPAAIQEAFNSLIMLAANEVLSASKVFAQKNTSDEIIEQVSFSVWSGYGLWRLSAGIPFNHVDNDHSKKNFKYVGELWAKSYEEDQCERLMNNIPPLESAFLYKESMTRLQYLVEAVPELLEMKHGLIARLGDSLLWATHMGFVIGQLEYTTHNG